MRRSVVEVRRWDGLAVSAVPVVAWMGGAWMDWTIFTAIIGAIAAIAALIDAIIGAIALIVSTRRRESAVEAGTTPPHPKKVSTRVVRLATAVLLLAAVAVWLRGNDGHDRPLPGWRNEDDEAGLISVADVAVDVEATQEQTGGWPREEVRWSNLYARVPAGVTAITYDMTLERDEWPVGQGSLELKLGLAGGEWHVLTVYVEDGRVSRHATKCADLSQPKTCSDSCPFPCDVVAGAELRDLLGDAVRVRAEWTGEAVVFSLDDEPFAEALATDGPIVEWQFSVAAGGDSAFHVSIDDPKVTYAGGG